MNVYYGMYFGSRGRVALVCSLFILSLVIRISKGKAIHRPDREGEPRVAVSPFPAQTNGVRMLIGGRYNARGCNSLSIHRESRRGIPLSGCKDPVRSLANPNSACGLETASAEQSLAVAGNTALSDRAQQVLLGKRPKAGDKAGKVV